MRREQVLVAVRRSPLRLAVFATLSVVVALLVPMGGKIQLGPLLDILHVPMFALLVILWMQALTSAWLTPRQAGAACVVVGTALALGTEYLQYWIPGRWPGWADVVRNLLGLALGLALFFWLGLGERGADDAGD